MGDYKDSAEYLARFTVLEDVYVGKRSYSEYQHGSKHDSVSEMVNYYPDGRVRSELGNDLADMMYDGDGYNTLRYIYDENGRLAKVQTLRDDRRRVDYGNSEVAEREMLYYADKITKELTLVYDDNGVLVSGNYGDDREIIYKCDSQGRIVENNAYPLEGSCRHFYTYDEKGRLVQRVCDRKSWLHEYIETRSTVTYEYDEDGHLKKTKSILETPYDGGLYLESEKEYAYETDEQGRVTKETLTYSTQWDVLPIMYTEYIYEDRYFFE